MAFVCERKPHGAGVLFWRSLATGCVAWNATRALMTHSGATPAQCARARSRWGRSPERSILDRGERQRLICERIPGMRLTLNRKWCQVCVNPTGRLDWHLYSSTARWALQCREPETLHRTSVVGSGQTNEERKWTSSRLRKESGCPHKGLDYRNMHIDLAKG